MRKLCALAIAVSASLSSGPLLHAEPVILPAGVPVPAGFHVIADYGSYRLFDGDATALPGKAWPLADAYLLKFDRMQIDTRLHGIAAPAGFALKSPSAAAL